jgi:Flp pilus assembly pilin Flp
MEMFAARDTRNTIVKIRRSSHQRGQGLVEYALILVLVAVVSIAVLGVAALAISRVYGIATATLGGEHQYKEVGEVLAFDSNQPPQCGYFSGHTGLYVQFYSSVDPDYLQVSTENSIDIDIHDHGAGSDTDLTGKGGQYYVAAQPVLADGYHPEVCPKSIVIQSDAEHGSFTAVYPVKFQNWSNP